LEFEVSRRERTLLGAVLAGVVAASALVVLVLAWDRGGEGESAATAEAAPAIEARATLTPRVMEFGDTLRASVDVTLDPSRVDPASVRVRTVFSPWRQVESPEVVRRSGETISFRTTYVLRCLTNACLSTGDVASVFLRFTEATVTYAPRADGAATRARQTIRAAWPGFLVRARFTQQAAQAGGPTPWLADLEALPAATYSMAPGPLLALLLAATTVLAVAGGVLAYLARPRRARRAQAPTEPPWRVLTPLQHALALLEDPARVNGTGDQRRALELVASALAERGDRKLARTARALAWSAPVPGVQETGGVAARARTALGEERHASPE
jgi:hypothetical protein